MEGARPLPFTIFAITNKDAVYAPDERAVTLLPFHLHPYVLCGLVHHYQPGLADVSGEVGPDLLRPARLAADGRQLIRHLCGAASASRKLDITKQQVNNMMTGLRNADPRILHFSRKQVFRICFGLKADPGSCNLSLC